MRSQSLIVAAVAVLTAVGTAPLVAQDVPARATVVFRDVNVLPMDTEEVLEHQTVLVRDGRIVEVAPDADAPADAVVVDGAGKFLMPGLSEMHAHVGSEEANARILPLFVLNGVTTARGMLGRPAHLDLRERIARGDVLGPRFTTSGPSFAGGDITPEEARQRVLEQAEAGYDFLKIHPGPSRAAFDALAEAAERAGIPFAGHVPADVGLERALEAGYHTIDHLDGFMEALVPGGVAPGQSGFFGVAVAADVDEAGIPALVRRVRDAGVAMVPTETLLESVVGSAGDAAELPEFAYWPPEQVAQWRQQRERFMSSDVAAGERARYMELRRRLIRDLHDAGVPILLGSDAPQVWNVPGFSVHRELALYVGAGLTPYEALRTGTVEVARHMGEEGSAGVVRPGARADLVLLDANPLEDIANARAIHGVMVDGRWISAEERSRRLEALRTDR